MTGWTEGLATVHRLVLVGRDDPGPRLVSLYWAEGKTLALVRDRDGVVVYFARAEAGS